MPALLPSIVAFKLGEPRPSAYYSARYERFIVVSSIGGSHFEVGNPPPELPLVKAVLL